MKIYDLTLDLKTCGHISFDMLSSNLRPDYMDLRYLIYIDSKVEKTFDEIFVALVVSVICQSQGRYLDMLKYT